MQVMFVTLDYSSGGSIYYRADDGETVVEEYD